MPAYDSDFFNISPYYDDFDEDKKYLKMLFKPGTALQARELTQVQSVIQNQIERFGNFVLDDGSMVYGGQITEIPTETRYIKDLSGDSVTIEGLVDKSVSFSRQSSGLTSFAKIIHSATDPNTGDGIIFYQYMNGEGFTGSDEIFIEGYNEGLTFTAYTTGNSEDSLVVFVDEGIRYTSGYFVRHEKQRIGLFEEYPESYTATEDDLPLKFNNVTRSVGFNVEKSIVTETQDITLRDPASGFYNYNAPGADRYKIDLKIAQRGITGSLDVASTTPFERIDYIEFLRVSEGNVIKKEKYADLGEIEETFARRTYDESGHYIVNPFDITMNPGLTDSELISKLDGGKAYVFGYEFETIGSTKLTHQKARDIRDTNGLVEYNYSMGPYVIMDFANETAGLSGFNLTDMPTVYFDSETGTTDGTVGSFDGVRFDVGGSATTKEFSPGLTLYFAYDVADLTGGSSYGASADLQATISKIIPFENQYVNGYLYVKSIEVISPFPTGSTSSFDTLPFYVAAGASFESGEDIYFEGSNVSFFNSANPLGLTGGPLVSPVGSFNIRSVQRINDKTHKIFFDNLSLQDSSSLSKIRRMYLETNLNDPAFFVEKVPVQIYNPRNSSLVFEAPYGDVVKNYEDFNFMVNLTITGNFGSASSFTRTLSNSDLSGFVQIGSNIQGSSVSYPLSSSQIVSVFTDDGIVDGDLQIIKSTPGTSNPDKIIINNANIDGLNVNNKQATFVISCQVNAGASIQNRRDKSLTSSSVNISFTGPDSSGYYYSYFESGGNYLSDVISVDSTTPSLTGFIFDSGQRDTYYDFAKIKILDDSITGGTAQISYYTHSGFGPFIGGGAEQTKSSYPDYENIEDFYSSSGKTISLRNSLDFRPVRGGTTQTFTLNGPYQNPTFVYDNFGNSVDYAYYLPRIDKIVLTKDKVFNIIEGVSNENPAIPSDSYNAMTLYTIRFNPYTFDENDVSIVQEDNRRFTMKDIGKLERRIENLEYYTTLNSLEQEAKTTPIYDNFGFEMPKKAFIVDQFTGSESSDVLNKDFYCSIDKETKELKPPFKIRQVDKNNITDLTGLTSNNDIVTFPFTEVEYLSNKRYNNSRRVNSNAIVDYNGTIKITPHCDTWFSTNKQPIVKTNNNNENDSWKTGNLSFELNTSFWNSHWFGKTNSSNKILPKKNTLKRNAVSKQISTSNITNFSYPQSNLSSTPEKVLDSNIVPFCRSKNVTLSASGLKPKKLHYIFFEDESIDNTQGIGITSDEYGKIDFNFSITGDTYPAGKKLFRITDDPNGNISLSTSSADGIYNVSGDPKDAESKRFIRPLITKRESSNSINITNDALTRDFQRKDRKSSRSKDNMCQIFSVSPDSYKKGLFLKSIDLYFDDYPEASSTEFEFEEKLPIKVYLKPVVNGYPSSSKIIAETELYEIGSKGTVVTDDNDVTYRLVNFSFSYPIFLEPGDYCLEIESNSTKYSLKTYVLPTIRQENQDIVERESVIDVNFGNLILPKNIGKYEKTQNEILTMVLYKCKFTGNSGSFKFTTNTIDKPSTLKTNINGLFVDSRHCYLDYDGKNISPNTDEQLIDTNNSDIDVNLSFIDEDISPVIDTEATNAVFSEFVLSSNVSEKETNSSDYLEDESGENRNKTYPRYVTKTVNTLQTANNVHVIFDEYLPNETSKVKVFLKRQKPNSEKTFEEEEYIELKRTVTNTTTDVSYDENYKPVEFKSEVDLEDFSTFAVKLVFLGQDKQKYPTVKNLKVIAV